MLDLKVFSSRNHFHVPKRRKTKRREDHKAQIQLWSSLHHNIHITRQSSFLAATKGLNISPKDFSLVERPGRGPFGVFIFDATVSPNYNLRFRVRVARFRPARSELNWMGRG